MGEFGDALELLHTPFERWTTLQATLLQRDDPERMRAANEQRVERLHLPRQPRPPGLAMAPAKAPSTTAGQIWAASPALLRVERETGLDDDARRQLVVVDGAHWVSWHPSYGGATNVDNKQTFRHHPARSIEAMFDPVDLLGLLRLRHGGSTEVDGRPCHHVIGVVHPLVVEPMPSPVLHVGADEVHLAVDRALGVVLRLESHIGGEPFSVAELTGVAVDETLDQALFDLRLPSDDPPKKTMRAAITVADLPRDVVLDVADSLAPIAPEPA